MSELSIALSNPSTGAAITAFARTALAATAAAVLAPEIGTIIAVAGAYVAVGAAYYAWKQAQNDQLQQLAISGLCSSANPVPSCGSGYYLSIYSTNNFATFKYSIYPTTTSASQVKSYKILDYIALKLTTREDRRWSLHLTYGDGRVHEDTIRVDPNTLIESPIDRKLWKDWTAAERESAIKNLTDAQWNQVLNQIASEGTLQPGQTLPNEVITLGNSQVQSAGTKALTAEQQALREAIKPELDKINSDIANNAAAIAAIAGTLGLIRNTTGNIDSNLANLGNTATQTKQSVDNVAGKVDAMKSEMNDNFNKVKKRLSGIASFINFDRILNIMIWWQTLHNCFMLSADLGRSLTSGISTVLKALPGDSLLGLPTEAEDGAPLDLGTKINQLFETAVKSAIGVDNYVKMQVELVKINRVYQSIANGVFMIQGGIQSLQNVTELTGERVGKVGNSLKRFRVVGEKAYEHFSENLNTRTSWFAKFENAVNAGQEVTSTVEQIASEVISVQDAFTQLKGQKEEFDKSLEDLTTSKRTDNKEAKEATEKAKAASESPFISQADQRKPEAA